MADIPTKIYDEAVKDVVKFDKYAAGLNNRVQSLLQKTQNEIVASIAANDPTAPTMTKWKLARLEKLNEDISEILKIGYDEIKKEVDGALKSVGAAQATNVVGSLNKSIGANIFDVTLTPDEVVGIVENTMIQGNVIGEWWDKQSADVQAKLSAQMAAGTQAIQIGLMQGESVGDLINRVRGTKLIPGVMALTKREATALVRTSVMQVANAVRMETYKKNRDILEGIAWCSTLDNRTTPLCQALDGKEWDMELNPIDHDMEYPGGPPAHWQCRSTILPVTLSWKALAGSKSKLSQKQLNELDKIPVGERASMNGLVPANLNYNNWLKTQPIEIQKEALGIGKWKLWSENNLSVTDLVDNSGSPISLRELKAKLGDIIAAKELEIEKELERLAATTKDSVEFQLKVEEVFSGKTLNKEVNFALDTSEMPLSRGALWSDLKDEDYRNMLIKKAGKGEAIEIVPQIERLNIFATNKAFLSTKEEIVYFGLDGEKFANLKKGDIFDALGTRSTSLTFERAKQYAGDSGTVFQLEIPKGVVSINAKVLGIEERMLLPGSQFKVIGKTDKFIKLQLIDDGSSYIKDLYDFQLQLNKLAGKTIEIDIIVPKIIREKGGYSKYFAEVNKTIEAEKAARIELKLVKDINDPSKATRFTPEDTISTDIFKPIDKVDTSYTVKTGEPDFLPFKGKSTSSGIIVVEDNGKVWLVSPKNEYGGYKNTFPKGGIEKGIEISKITLQKAAIREVFEESGLQTKIIGYLGDYERNTSATRYYIGKRTGGSPIKMGKESEAVWLVPQSQLKEFLNASIDKKIADDFLATYNEAMKLGEGDFAKGMQIALKEKEFKAEFEALSKAYPDVKLIEFQPNATWETKLKVADEKLNERIASKFEFWSTAEGTAEKEAFDKFVSIADSDPRKAYKSILSEAERLESKALTRLTDFDNMTYAEAKALNELKSTGATYAGEPAYSIVYKMDKTASRLRSDAAAELKSFKAAGLESVERHTYDKILTKKVWSDDVELVDEIKYESKKLVKQAEIELNAFKSTRTPSEVVEMYNEIALYDPTFTTSNIIRQSEILKSLSDGIEKSLAEIDSILSKGSGKLGAEYLLRVPADLNVGKRLEMLKAIVEEEKKLAIVSESVKKTIAAAGETVGRTAESLTKKEVEKLLHMRTYDLRVGKIPPPGSSKILLWDSLSSDARKTFLDTWIRKGVKIPDEFLIKYYRDAMTSTIAPSAKKAFVAFVDIPDLSIGKIEDLITMVGKASITDDIVSGRKLYWKKLTYDARDNLRKLTEGSSFSSPREYVIDLVKKMPDSVVLDTPPLPKTVAPIIDKETKLQLSDYRMYAPQKGSNPGGFYCSKDNPADRWYFKFPDDINQTKNELLAARLYQAAGVEVPDIILVEGEAGKIGIASRIVDGVEASRPKLIGGTIKAGITDDFVIDAWLANWDVVGGAYDNLLIKDGVRAVRIDVGGSLLYRAKAGRKSASAFGDTVGELVSMTSGSKNAEAVSVFKNVSKEDMKIGAAKLARISDGKIRKIVEDFGYGTALEKDQMAVKLIARKNYILDYVKDIEKVASPLSKIEPLTNIQVETLKVADEAGTLNKKIIGKYEAIYGDSLGVNKEIIEKISKRIEEDMLVCQNIAIEKSSVYQSLLRDPILKNQFALGRGGASEGSYCPYKGGARDRWEKRYSKGILQTNKAYQRMSNNSYFTSAAEIEAAFERPVYGFVMNPNNIDAARGYGPLTAVYKSDAKKRMSYTIGNSSGLSDNLDELGSAKGNSQLVGRFLAKLNERRNGKVELNHFLNGDLKLNQIGFDTKTDYIEAQIYGKNYLNREIELFFWRDNSIPKSINDFADRMGVKIYTRSEFERMMKSGKI